MTPEQFCYWLQGMLEPKDDNDFFTLKETRLIRDHLGLVFDKVTPDRTDDAQKCQDAELRTFNEMRKNSQWAKRYC